MSNGIGVLGLDAADFRLVSEFECKNIQLDCFSPLETYSYSSSNPKTSEVWPTIATGAHPTDFATEEMQWKDPKLKFASNFTKLFPQNIRSKLGEAFINRESGSELSLPTVDHDHVFEAGSVYDWPGITDCPNWIEARKWVKYEFSEQDLRRYLYSMTGREFGWLSETIQADVPVAGVQCHILDVAGHTYGSRESKIRNYYKYVDELVGLLRKRVDRLIIVSDHGIQSTVTDDSNPGTHSFDAMIATQNIDGDLPDSVFEIREFIEQRIYDKDTTNEKESVDAPREHLEDLGYI